MSDGSPLMQLDDQLVLPESDPLVRPESDPLVKKRTIAIVGASADRSKFGNKCVRAYAAEGWQVWPVHPKATEIEGWRVYPSVAELPGLPDRVSLYLREEAALAVLVALARLESHHGSKVSDVYLNPGVDTEAVRERADQVGLNNVSSCAIRAIGHAPDEFPGE